jgi:hypothetical protein
MVVALQWKDGKIRFYGMPIPTLEDFVAVEGSQFMVHFTDISIPLALVQAFPLPPPPEREQILDFIRKTPFRLVFRGPLDTPLQQETYRLSHDRLGDLDLTVVPIRKDEEGIFYSVVVN